MTATRSEAHTSSLLVPAFLVRGLPAGLDDAARALGVPTAAFGAVRDAAVQADFDLPRGTSWRLYPELGAALWIARDAAAAIPPVPGGWEVVDIDLITAVLRLSSVGVWLAEASILVDDEWSEPMQAPKALAQLARDRSARGLSGTWGDETGRAVTAELYTDGRIWADDHARAELWLLVAAGLVAEPLSGR